MPFDSLRPSAVCLWRSRDFKFLSFFFFFFLSVLSFLAGASERVAQSTRIALIVGIIYYNPPDYKSERERRRRRTKDKRGSGSGRIATVQPKSSSSDYAGNNI